MITASIDKAIIKSRPVRYSQLQSQNAKNIARIARHAREDTQAGTEVAINDWPKQLREFTPKSWEAGYIDVTDEPLYDVVHLIETGQVSVVRIGNRWMARAT